MSKAQVLAVTGALILGAIVCAGILAVTLGTANSLFWPALGASMMIVAIVAVLTQKPQKRE